MLEEHSRNIRREWKKCREALTWVRDACSFSMDGTQTKRKHRDRHKKKKKICRRGEEIENMELENQNTTSCLKSSPREWGRLKELSQQEWTSIVRAGLLHRAWDFQATRHVYCPILLSNSGEAEVGRQNQDHAQLTGPQSMHILGLGISPALNSEEISA